MEARGYSCCEHRATTPFYPGVLLLALLVCAPLCSGAASVAPAADALDIRVVVDGRAWSDSAAQRAGLDSAVHALLSVVPAGTTTAVWPLGSAAASADLKAQHAAGADHSPGAQTQTAASLAAVFERLLKEWSPSNGNRRRHVILLVAGAQHTDKGSATHVAADEKRLLNELLPRLHQTGAAVHAIAPAPSDTSLLQQLVIATDGWYTDAADPRDAERHLLMLLENLAGSDTLPLHDGLVRFDTSVASAHLVLFRSDPNLPARLIPPGTQGFSQFNAPKNVSWRPEARFDVVTITKPAPGTWQIESEGNEGNRVFADAALRLVMSSQSRNALSGRRREINLALHQDGKPITERRVLEHVVIKVAQYQGEKEQRLWFPLDNGRNGDSAADDGIYTVALDDFLPAQSYRFVAEVEGLNFQRRQQQRMDVHDQPAWAHLAHGAHDGQFLLSVLPRYGLLDPEMMTVVAHLSQAGMDPVEMQVPRYTSTTWRLELELDTRSVQDRLEVNVQANTTKGLPMSLWLPAIELPAARHSDEAATRAHSDHSAHVAHDEEHSTANALAVDDTPWPVWLAATLQLFGINALLAALTWLALRYWRKREAHWHTEIESALAHD